MAVRVKIVAVFGEIFWGGIWRVLALKVAVSNFDLLETLIRASLPPACSLGLQIIQKKKNQINACLFIFFLRMEHNWNRNGIKEDEITLTRSYD